MLLSMRLDLRSFSEGETIDVAEFFVRKGEFGMDKGGCDNGVSDASSLDWEERFGFG